MNWKTWLQGLAAAAVGGAAGTTAQIVNNRVQYGQNAPPITAKSIGVSAGLGALVTSLAYLMQSPLTTTPTAPTKASEPTATTEAK